MIKNDEVLEMVQWCKSQDISLNETQNIIKRTFGSKGIKFFKKLASTSFKYEMDNNKSEYAGKLEILSERAKEEIQSVMKQDEELIICMNGSSNDFMVVTNQRVLIAKHGLSFGGKFGLKINEIPYVEIGDIVVHESSTTWFIEIASVTNMPKKKSIFKRTPCGYQYAECDGIHILKENYKFYKPFIALLKSKLVEIKQNINTTSPDKDLTNKVKSLAKLYRTGKISRNEYETAKTRVMEQKWY